MSGRGLLLGRRRAPPTPTCRRLLNSELSEYLIVHHISLFTILDVCVSSLRRGHANIIFIVPSLTDDPRRESAAVRGFHLRASCAPDGRERATLVVCSVLIACVFCLCSVAHVFVVMFYVICVFASDSRASAWLGSSDAEAVDGATLTLQRVDLGGATCPTLLV